MQRPVVVNTAAYTRGVVGDETLCDCQCATVVDSASCCPPSRRQSSVP